MLHHFHQILIPIANIAADGQIGVVRKKESFALKVGHVIQPLISIVQKQVK
jgi:hypothetical protein